MEPTHALGARERVTRSGDRDDIIYINGRFLTSPFSGVQRVAYELLTALDRLLAHSRCTKRFELLHPPGISNTLNLTAIATRQVGHGGGQYWEQVELPIAARHGFLLNLCNVGPLFKRRSATMIHDAQVHTMPASYSFAFRTWYKIAQPTIGKFHQSVLTVSAHSKAEIAAFGVAPSEKIAVVSNGCDHVLRVSPDDNVIAKFGLARGRYVVSLASLQRHKNISVLLRAFSSARLQEHSLILFGSATAEGFRSLGYDVPSNVLFAGRLSDAELVGLMAGAGCFACPSLTEGFGLMPLEAMAVGCPTVVAPCGALAEVCEHASVFADPYSPDEWAEQLARVLTNSDLRSDLIAKGYARAALYSWDSSARALMSALDCKMTGGDHERES